MKTTLLLIIASAFFSLKAEAKKSVYPLEMIISMSDLIVTGEISEIDAGTYTFKISETLKGKSDASITVQKFREWECDQRQKPYMKSQRLVLFLHKNGSEYEIINGSSGELFIIGNDVEYLYENQKKPKVADFLQAVKNFQQCYALKADYDPFGTNTFKTLKNKKAIESMRAENEFSTWLFDRAKNYGTVK